MVKQFCVVLDNPPENGYVPNSDVIGHVLLVIDGAKSGYKAIEVHATVHWSETQGTGDDRRTVFYSSCEDYVANTEFFGAGEVLLMDSCSLQVPIFFEISSNRMSHSRSDNPSYIPSMVQWDKSFTRCKQ